MGASVRQNPSGVRRSEQPSPHNYLGADPAGLPLCFGMRFDGPGGNAAFGARERGRGGLFTCFNP